MNPATKLLILYGMLVAVVTVEYGSASISCPTGCICDERNGGAKCKNMPVDAFKDGQWPGVKTLYLTNNEITALGPDVLQGFSGLMNLFVSLNPMEELNLAAFKDNEMLIQLKVTECNVERIIPLAAGQKMPNLRYLILNDNKLTSLPEDILNGLDHERLALQLGGNFLVLPGDKHFLASLNLYVLDLSDMDASGISTETFKSLPNLQYLVLSNSSLTDVSNKFNLIPKLTTLALSHNPIEEIKEGFLSEDQKLTWLDLSYSKLESIKEEAIKGRTKSYRTALILDHTPYGCECKYERIVKYFLTIDRRCGRKVKPCSFST